MLRNIFRRCRTFWTARISSRSLELRVAGGIYDDGEVEFLHALVDTTGCRLLCDVSNVFLSGQTGQHHPYRFMDEFPGAVAELHLGGFTAEVDEASPGGTLLVDTHAQRVADPVWALYAHALRRFGAQPTIIEWDNDLPALAVLTGEAAKANRVREVVLRRSAVPTLAEVQAGIRDALVDDDNVAVMGLLVGGARPERRLAIHQRHYADEPDARARGSGSPRPYGRWYWDWRLIRPNPSFVSIRQRDPASRNTATPFPDISARIREQAHSLI